MKSKFQLDAALFTLPLSDSYLVAAEGVEPSSLDYRSRALPLSYTAEIDP